ncbi:DUF4291 family protein [Streptomyces sp. NPDC093064]|uniref:DUF4291 family protein n=1 Tax=unclassified Streptomyces TaxID=2593676 RepID=UPI0036A686CF
MEATKTGEMVCEHGLTWIKPSFLWMMYRCGWGAKAGQETVLAVEITRDGFEWALRHACLSSYARGVHADRATWQRELKRAPTRVQWDPERDLRLQPLPYRISGAAFARCAGRPVPGPPGAAVAPRLHRTEVDDHRRPEFLPTPTTRPAS